MKSTSIKFLLLSLLFSTYSLGVSAQDDDGIYGDIYQAPEVEDELIDTTTSPLDGYSTVDDYYPEEGYTPAADNSNQPYSEQYVDENGNNVTNNYYGDHYEDDSDYFYSSRIRRFHRNYGGWGYYDPWYTNMYYYNYDPFFWDTSINVGFWPNYGYGWSGGFGGWGFGYNPYGWNSYANPMFGYPACYGGGGWYGYGGNYWNGYNNGFNDGLAYGGYYNTFDSNSGIYYGHRGSTGNSGSSIGSGYRATSFASVYNDAAKDGKVAHANKGNVLQTADARPVKSSINSVRSTAIKGEVSQQTSTISNRGVASDRSKGEIGSQSTRTTATSTRGSGYERGASERATSTPQRNTSSNVDRSRYRATTSRPRTSSSSTIRSNTYQRGNEASRYSNRQQATQPSRPAASQDRGNMYRDLQRTQPSNRGYNRGNSNSNQYTRPAQPSRNATQPSRNYQQPSRNTTSPSRNYQQPSRSATPSRTQPSRSVSPAPSPSRGSSNRSFSTPSRSSGSIGGSRGSSSSPSRGSSSPSRGGRP